MEPQTNINVNGRNKRVVFNELTYEQVAIMAYGNLPNPKLITLTITYAKGVYGAQGSMLPNDKVEIVDGMVFNVTATDKA